MKKIKVGLASFGMSGQVFHAPFINAHSGFELSAIVERSKDLSKEHYPDAIILRSLEELVSVNEIDLVVVNTPDETHYQYCKMALLAGKNVVVEKPFVSTLREAEELIAIAKERDLLLTVFQNRRFDGDFLTAKKVVKSGELGRIVEFSSAVMRYRPNPDNTWKENPEKRLGLIYNLGAHYLDQALVLFGLPKALFAIEDRHRDGYGLDDYYEVVLFYPQMKVNVRGSMLAKEPTANFVVHGTQGSYVAYACDPQEAALKAGQIDPLAEGWGRVDQSEWGVINCNEGRKEYPMLAGNYINFYDNIYSVLANGSQPEVTHRQMIALMKMLEACLKSKKEGIVVKLQP